MADSREVAVICNVVWPHGEDCNYQIVIYVQSDRNPRLTVFLVYPFALLSLWHLVFYPMPRLYMLCLPMTRTTLIFWAASRVCHLQAMAKLVQRVLMELVT